MVSHPRLIALCRQILSAPAVSFHEHGVARILVTHAQDCRLPWAFDRWGNLHVRTAARRDSRCWMLLAHMDHPGFVIESVTGRRASARWFGRVERRYFRSARVRIQASGGHPVRARILRTHIAGPLRRVCRLELLTEAPVAPGDLGTWDLPTMRLRGTRLMTRAADDLIGCATLAALLETLAAQPRHAPVEVIYTRAEEAGLLGATALARDGAIARRNPLLSLETSRAKPEAPLGGGIVLRVGDRVGAFDGELLRHLHVTAEEIARGSRRFRFRRALMDGGTCEASPFAAYGYRSGGLAIPLANYHNMGRTRIAAEAVDLRDVSSALTLLVRVVAKPPPARWPAAAPRELFERWLAPQEAQLLKTALTLLPAGGKHP